MHEVEKRTTLCNFSTPLNHGLNDRVSVKLCGRRQIIQLSIPSWVTQSRPQWSILLPNIMVGLFRFLRMRPVGTRLSALSTFCA